MKELIFVLSNDGKIKLTEECWNKMKGYMQLSSNSLEAGGVLLGRFIKDSKNVILDNITVPMIGDKRSRYSFSRRRSMHQRIVDRFWDKSNGTCNYLGEWHTHPEDYPSPSDVDYADWKRKLKEDHFSSRYLYFIIVGLKHTYIWEGDRRSKRIIKLNKV